MTYIIIALSSVLVLAFLKCQRLDLMCQNKETIIHNQNRNFEVVTIEQKNIMSLNKLCIEKWEKSVLENVNLAQTNNQLMLHIQELQSKIP